MFELVPSRPDLVRGEHAILKFWEEDQTFQKLRAKVSGKPVWSFIDGPITANGFMGVHHAWGRTYKDAFQRYFAMTGHDQRWQNGFDCQGLWVEVQVERDLGFKSKRDIERYGVEAFVQRCKERVLKYSAIQTEQSIRLGMWMDWPNSYFTMSDENNYTIWKFLKRCHDRGFVYKGLDAMPWCPRCGTGISEQERKEGYRRVEDDAVYVRFPLRGRPGQFLLIWTTTPWTLPANVAAAVNPSLTYLKASVGDEVYYLAAGRQDVLKAVASSQEMTLEEMSGADLLGWQYDGPFDEFSATKSSAASHRVIAWDEVTETDGTGIVHIAPGCGKEDFDLGKQEALPIISPIDDSGVYLEGFGSLTGKPALEAAPEVCEALKGKGLLFHRERYAHDYPHCWRCSTPLLFRAVDEWYISMEWRDEIKQAASKIKWIPSYGKDLELDWLKNMGDWMISKKRYWGLALPIFQCGKCDWFDVIGSRAELADRAVEGWEVFAGDPSNAHSPHRPWIDAVKIKCEKCGGLAARIPDVGNPWLDAGIVPYSTTGYNGDKDYWARWVPADFVVESFPGQFRNWFYALLTMSTMMENIPPFKTLLGYASVRDEKGEEMHYSKGNAIEFDEAADKMSADVMRWMYCRQTATNNLNFGYQAGDQLQRKVFGTLWNSYLFFTNYARLDGFDPSAPQVPFHERPEIDRWLVSDLQLLVKSARRQFDEYLISPFIQEAEKFIEQLSNWYIRRNRQRFWAPRISNQSDKLAAYQTLHYTLLTLVKLLAPVIPFLTERIYRNLSASQEPHSVHLCDFPAPDDNLIDEALSFQMGFAQEVARAGRGLRESCNLRVRQPLAQMLVVASSQEERTALDRLGPLVIDELNLKSLKPVDSLSNLTTVTAKPNFGTLGPKYGSAAPTVAEAILNLSEGEITRLQEEQGLALSSTDRPINAEKALDGIYVTLEDAHFHVTTKQGWATAQQDALQIALDTRLTPELEKEGLARDFVRHIQALRKDLGLHIEDHIECYYETDDDELKQAIAEWHDYIAGETQADSLSEGSTGLTQTELEINGRSIMLEIILRSVG